MADRDRTTIDLAGLRSRIENFRQDAAWRSLSMAKKMKVLIEERLDDQSEEARIAIQFLRAAIKQESLSGFSDRELAILLDVDPVEVRAFRDRLR